MNNAQMTNSSGTQEEDEAGGTEGIESIHRA